MFGENPSMLDCKLVGDKEQMAAVADLRQWPGKTLRGFGDVPLLPAPPARHLAVADPLLDF